MSRASLSDDRLLTPTRSQPSSPAMIWRTAGNVPAVLTVAHLPDLLLLEHSRAHGARPDVDSQPAHPHSCAKE